MALAFRFPAVLVPRDGEERVVLSIVPESDRRYVRVFIGAMVALMLMALVVVLRVNMAHQQMRIDSLNYDISRARLHFDTLRAQRADLQSPEKLMESARSMGLVPSLSVRIIDIPPAIAAEVASTVGKVDADVAAAQESPLDEFGRLKPAVVGSP